MSNGRRQPQKWKCSRGRPLRIGQTIIRTSNSTTLTIRSPLKIRRIRATDLDNDIDQGNAATVT